MSVDFTAIAFVGAIFNPIDLYKEGPAKLFCRWHGEQGTKFCAECGNKCHEERDKVFTEAFCEHADRIYKTPEELWQELSEDECYGEGFGVYRYGYDNDFRVIGVPLARVSGNSHPNHSTRQLEQHELDKQFCYVFDEFENFGIERIVRLIVIQDCG